MYSVEAMAKLGSAIVLVALIAMAVATLPRLFGDKPTGSENLIGRKPPQFAAPLTTGSSDKVANITQLSEPHPKSRPACSVNLPGVFNSCKVGRRPLVIAFWANNGAVCLNQIDAFNRAAKKSPEVVFVAVGIDQKREDAAAIAMRRGWTLPVAVDPDGAVSAIYSVAGCPSTFFVNNGRISAVKLGRIGPAALKVQLKKVR